MSEENVTIDSKEIDKSSVRCKPEVEVIDSGNLEQCKNEYHIPLGRKGPIVVKMPVVLSDVEVQIGVEAEIILEDAHAGIKAVDRHIYITKCRLIPYTNRLCIEGNVQKSIQYTSFDCINKIDISSDIRHATINIPFECTTEIKFSKSPKYGRSHNGKQDILNANLSDKDDKEDFWFQYSKQNECIYCELEYARIVETNDCGEECSNLNIVDNESSLKEHKGEMIICIRLKVLQNQYVYIPELGGDVKMLDNYPAGFTGRGV
jgi:hypothetical protein